ncbi:MAG: dependent ligase [Verrucomicrobiales bacterium]|nr:dependent ligase [Verrucomicrobiales bacterium]
MQRFTKLFCELDQTTRTNEKVAVLENYFREAPPADAAWALAFLSGRTPPRVISTRNLWDWASVETGFPAWLMEECYESVGDLAEMLALLFQDSGGGTLLTLSQIVSERLLPIRELADISKRQLLVQTWRELNRPERLVWNKLITGEFRIGVSKTLVVRALANVAKVEPAIMAHRVLGKWQPTAEDFKQLLKPEGQSDFTARPYPFFLASPIEIKLKSGESIADEFGDVNDWQAEWKWDGIRAQLIHRAGETSIWSRGEEMVTDSFPELVNAGKFLSEGTVLDGEILAWRGDRPLIFGELQRRLGRKKVSDRTQRDFPIAFLAYDLLEKDGSDIRAESLEIRRTLLENVLEESAHRFASETPSEQTITQQSLALFTDETTESSNAFCLRLSPVLSVASWEELESIRSRARDEGVEGIMLKRRASSYGVGRPRGDWWKWKINPHVIDAVLIYAQRGHGRRANLYTDYTFGVWDKGELVPVAKAYSGLTDEEIRKVDHFVRKNSLEKHGPVRIVKPELVFELAFEAVLESTRHKSGIAVRFPRMNRWRHDKTPAEADTIENLRALTSSRPGLSIHELTHDT